MDASHPNEVPKKASVPATDTTTTPGMQALRNAVPPHCLRANSMLSLAYIVRDVTLALCLAFLALRINSIDSDAWRMTLWTVYGFLQGLIFTGIWILAHECGHQALFNNGLVNDSMGFVLHSLLLVPFFSWKYSHARHHRYTNNMQKDMAFVPLRKDDFRVQKWLGQVFEIGEDAPALNLALLVGHQIVGWPLYLLFCLTSGTEGLSSEQSRPFLRNSHYDPSSGLWSKSQRQFILASDLGLLAVGAGLWYLAENIGYSTVAVLYGVPYLWVNHWIVAITYLHHTHPTALHYEDSAWTFQKGALATVDRDFGFIGRHLFHGIIEYHVIHHLFPRIPFYYAEEATWSVQPLLGKQYLREETSFVKDLWQTFVSLKYVEPVSCKPGELGWASPSAGVSHLIHS